MNISIDKKNRIMSEEKRKFMRFDAPINIEYNFSGKKIKKLAISKNISRKGINIFLAEKLNPGIKLELQLSIPDEIIPIFAIGRLIWIKKIDNQSKNRFSAGIAIEKMAPFDLNTALQYAYNYWKDNISRKIRKNT